MESFRTTEELFNLQCWGLTCETFFRPESWQWLFDLSGYTGDHEFIYFEPPARPPDRSVIMATLCRSRSANARPYQFEVDAWRCSTESPGSAS